jgi:DNA-directed RNA polymerase subunit RPC12/RpoP
MNYQVQLSHADFYCPDCGICHEGGCVSEFVEEVTVCQNCVGKFNNSSSNDAKRECWCELCDHRIEVGERVSTVYENDEREDVTA